MEGKDEHGMVSGDKCRFSLTLFSASLGAVTLTGFTFASRIFENDETYHFRRLRQLESSQPIQPLDGEVL
jgi:hypothetical protein